MKGSARLTVLVLAAILILSGCGGDATPASGASSSSSVSEAAEPSSSLAEQSEKSSASSAPDDVKENPETPSSPEASMAESSVSQTGTIDLGVLLFILSSFGKNLRNLLITVCFCLGRINAVLHRRLGFSRKGCQQISQCLAAL